MSGDYESLEINQPKIKYFIHKFFSLYNSAIGVIFKAIAKVTITKRIFVASRMFGRKLDLIRILYFCQ